MRSNVMLQSMNIETRQLANDDGDDKKNLFDSPHSGFESKTTAPNTKTMRTIRQGLEDSPNRGKHSESRSSSPRKDVKRLI
jgi:hypothetical protein